MRSSSLQSLDNVPHTTSITVLKCEYSLIYQRNKLSDCGRLWRSYLSIGTHRRRYRLTDKMATPGALRNPLRRRDKLAKVDSSQEVRSSHNPLSYKVRAAGGVVGHLTSELLHHLEIHKHGKWHAAMADGNEVRQPTSMYWDFSAFLNPVSMITCWQFMSSLLRVFWISCSLKSYKHQ